MNCLESVELMDLLYGEADPATLQGWRRHLATCPKCRGAYWQLKDTSDWIRKNEDSHQPVVLLMPPPAKKPGVFLKVAAAAVLILSIGTGGLYIGHFKKQAGILVAKQHRIEQKLENANLRVQETNRNQYMMLLALKDYLDKNYQTRKVSYEKFR